MVQFFYESMFFLSFLLTAIYVYQWKRHFSVDITVIFLLILIANLGYVLYGGADNSSVLVAATKVLYLGGCFLPFYITMCILDLCKVKVEQWHRFGCFLLSSMSYLCVLSVGMCPFFYKDIQLLADGSISKTYGVAHNVFYGLIFFYFVIGFTSIFIATRKKQVSRKILSLLFFPEFLSVWMFFVQHFINTDLELIPISYVFSQLMFILIIRRMSMLNINETAMDAILKSGDTGLISIDRHMNYLSSNRTAQQFFPALKEAQVDSSIMGLGELSYMIKDWIDDLDRHDKDRNIVKLDHGLYPEEEYYAVSVRYLLNGDKRLGYQIYITDDTENQRYLALTENYNRELERDVEKKTRHIMDMHDNLILSMASMVESRDNSTGGHIRRTSEGVRSLVGEMPQLPEKFRKNLIKAAPMHDIGKIAVDDAVLRKPGKFTPEEFEKMKMHPHEGKRIVSEILASTDDASFRRIAENVAHYHHEKWNGQGYPDGLVGEEIPLEARIMAIADVYDALVSKRVYKESFSFEKADRIILESMGAHFDPALESVYRKARPALENYYRTEADTGIVDRVDPE